MKITREKEKRLELLTALVFSALILLLSATEVAYISLGDNRYMDLSVIPAVFAFMIGGPLVVVPVAVAWGVMGFLFMPAAPLYGLSMMVLVRLMFALSCWAFYRLYKKINPGSPNNVYYGLTSALLLKWMTTNVVMTWVGANNRFNDIESYILLLMEMILCNLAMFMIVGKLREIHILNGIRRKEKRTKKEI